jgi:hypothetical protein
MMRARRPLLFCLMLLCIGLVACDGGSRGGAGGGSDDDDDDDDDTPSSPCEAEFEFAMLDGTTATNDYCASATLQATYEFDPDDPPKVRSPEMLFQATTEQDFDCWVRIDEPQVCGQGYYRMDGSSGTVEFNTSDCTGVGDDYEGVFTAGSGYVYIASIYAGDTPGNFSGEALSTTLSGSLAIQESSGLGLSGNFHIIAAVTARDAEEGGCTVSDGDEDDDGFIDVYFGGDDCDDDNAAVGPGLEEVCDELDNDCDGNIDNVQAPAGCWSAVGNWQGTYAESYDLVGFPFGQEGVATAIVTYPWGDAEAPVMSGESDLGSSIPQVNIAFSGSLEGEASVFLDVTRTSDDPPREVVSFGMDGSFDRENDTFQATGTFTGPDPFGRLQVLWTATLELTRVDR